MLTLAGRSSRGGFAGPIGLFQADLETERLEEGLHGLFAARDFFQGQRAFFGELKFVGHADDRFGVELAAIDDQEHVSGFLKAVMFQEVIAPTLFALGHGG